MKEKTKKRIDFNKYFKIANISSACVYWILSIISCIIIFSSFLANAKHASTLTIYTYDSFVSEWGPGPIIEKIFEEKFNNQLEFIAVDSAATLLTKIILEGSSTKADIVLGLDMNLLDEANKSNLLRGHGPWLRSSFPLVLARKSSDFFQPTGNNFFLVVRSCIS